MGLKRFLQLAIPLILTGLTACDNVSWGGVELRLRTPVSTAAESDESVEDPGDEPAPEPAPDAGGPVLGIVTLDGDEARLLPVAVLGSEGLRPVPAGDRPGQLERFGREHVSGVSRFVLFSDGGRVGTFFPDSTGPIDRSFCNPRPTASGSVELLPEASGVSRFLALPEEQGRQRDHTRFSPVSSTRSQRVASLRMAGTLFPRIRARWPPSVLDARADLQVVRLSGQDTLLAATFLYGDRLEVGEAPETAYSLFFLAAEDEGGFSPVYVRYRPVARDGKQAPRFLDHLDWDGDGRDEVLLEVFGSDARSFAALDPEGPGWEESFRERCSGDPGAVTAEPAIPGGAPPRR